MKRYVLFSVALSLAFSLGAAPAIAKSDEANLLKLGAFKRTDTGPMMRVPQGGKYADNLRKILRKIKMKHPLQVLIVVYVFNF